MPAKTTDMVPMDRLQTLATLIHRDAEISGVKKLKPCLKMERKRKDVEKVMMLAGEKSPLVLYYRCIQTKCGNSVMLFRSLLIG